jgi:hypothetical protein
MNRFGTICSGGDTQPHDKSARVFSDATLKHYRAMCFLVLVRLESSTALCHYFFSVVFWECGFGRGLVSHFKGMSQVRKCSSVSFHLKRSYFCMAREQNGFLKGYSYECLEF